MTFLKRNLLCQVDRRNRTRFKWNPVQTSQCISCRGAKDNKGFGFALSAWFIVATVKGYFCGVSLILNALVAGNGSYILWPLVALS